MQLMSDVDFFSWGRPSIFPAAIFHGIMWQFLTESRTF
jgi:hypothetical protein